ncbi:archaemetzincin [Hymenobacter chitinivorans]|uniref:Archaemetzincin n=1 Tax=Hymenobacter chitinivorans DSM 11115 TaxID=1121954 RepID=A0A2M9B582_9BACT|nr:archaemetzincin [Hymenobacter chitinivorans]PJJ53102.1 archaemetzincin [Hymenobacter chitinivorans DSM 11115]
MAYLFFPLLVFLFSCGRSSSVASFSSAAESYFQAIQKNDFPLKKPQPGEWLYENREAGQNLEAYQQLPPFRPDSLTRTIYLQPVGRFSALQRQALQATQEYLRIFYQQPVVLLPAVADTLVPPGARRRQNGHEQLLAPYLINYYLKTRLPRTGLALMAISAKDLYPEADWNYVFGQASYPHRVGITSIYRLQDQTLTPKNYTRCLTRLLSISSHEIGHMVSLHHCTYARCAMNGTNSLPETDATPNRLCSECQTKLYWNFRYDNVRRLQELAAFFRKNQLRRDGALAQMDLRQLR